MRILFIGDIVGRPGKHACSQIVPRLIFERGIDCVIANAENSAAGSGITPKVFQKLRNQGIDACTLGDHIYRRHEIIPMLRNTDRMVRSANFPPEAAGPELIVVPTRRGLPVALFSVLGRTFMNVRSDCPFHAADRILERIPADVRHIIVDVHAETTSEKLALGWYLDGRATAVCGTHTHVQTADERVLPGGTAYITDVGMTGPHDSVLGRDKHAVMRALVTGMPHPYGIAHDDVRLHGVIIEADDETGRARAIERISIVDESPPPPGDDND